MLRKSFLLSLTAAAGIVAGATAYAWHQHDASEHSPVKPIAVHEIVELVNGKKTTATAVQVTFEADQGGTPHRHPGPVLGYILEGEYEWAIDDKPAKVLKAGDTFYEPAGCLHRVSKNAGKEQVRVLAWVIHPADAEQLVIPEDK